MRNLIPDVRFALRAMRRSPLFTAVAILSLALGIGANTAIFTILDQLMLRSLPVRDPENLVMLFQRGAHNGSNMGGRMHSYPIYQDFQQKAAPLAEVLCRRLADTSISVDQQTERVRTELVSGNYFSMLGVKPALGRVFSSQEDDRVFQGHPVVVLGYDYWQSRFGGSRDVIGKKILVNNYPMTIVGVSAAGFAGIDPARAAQIRVPVLMHKVVTPEWTWVHMSDRRTRWVQVFARLKPGYTAETARPGMQVLFRQIREMEAGMPAAAKWSPFARQRFLEGSIHVEKAGTGYSELRNSFSNALVVLMAMVGLVLLIACANVANLLIARAFARQKEIAVRLSLGASRGQLVRQLLVESMMLAAAGGALGVGLASLLTRSLLAFIPQDGDVLLIQAEPDGRVLAFTLGVTLLTGLVFGLMPALRASRPDLWGSLKDAVGAIAGGGGSLVVRKGLVSAQVALSFLLLFGAGLFVRSLQNLRNMDTGYEELDNVITFGVAPALNGYTEERANPFYRSLTDSLNATTGFRSAAAAAVGVLAGDEWDSSMSVEGHKAKDGEDMQAFMNSFTPGYFKTMGIRVLEGRDFEWRDAAGQSKVAIVNEKFARHFFGQRSAIGRRLGWGGGPDAKLDIEIVGVVEDSLQEGPREGGRRQVFLPKSGNGRAAYYVRANVASTAAYSAIRAEMKRLDPAMPVYDLRTLSNQLDQTLLTERLVAMLSAGFGLLATLLAAVGLYGVMAFVVTRRTKELGLRMALGAAPDGVIWLVMREVMLLLGIGLAIGVPAALGLGRYVAAQLYGIKPADPGVIAVTVVVLLVVSGLAGFVPARRASRIDPIIALRYE
ncbi:MAG: ABC transporter permease [Acidobacteria bacterium]|nr:ABC transporter permease [Acidobacteriota bacterium]